MGVLTVIWWRDIPAQVVAKDGRRASKIVLHPRFQVAIDRAAVKAGRRSMDDYIAEWHKIQRSCGDDLEAEATAEVARLEATYTRRVLDHLVTTGGVDTPAPSPAAAADESAAKPAAKEPATRKPATAKAAATAKAVAPKPAAPKAADKKRVVKEPG